LVEVFGTLEIAPRVIHLRPIVAFAIFEEAYEVQQVVQSLHGIRSLEEQRKARGAPPQECEKFVVQLLSDAAAVIDAIEMYRQYTTD